MMRVLPFIAVSGLLASLSIEAFGIHGRANRTATRATGPVVVELFTSEGCSSCPPADDWLREIAAAGPVDGAAVIALSEHVDYWNRLGWKDPFSSAAMTARQNRYARALESEVYTPQMVVDGGVAFVGSDRQAAAAAIRAAASSKKAALTANLALAGPAIDVRATIRARRARPVAGCRRPRCADGRRLGLERRRRREPGSPNRPRRGHPLSSQGRPGEGRK